MKALGYRLGELIDKSKLSQTEIARQAGIQRTSLSRYCNDRIVPSLPILIKILEVIGASTQDTMYLLFGGRETEDSTITHVGYTPAQMGYEK